MNKIINIVLASLLGGSLVLCTQETIFALEQNRISATVAQGKASESATVSVSPYGIVLSFEDLGESIEKYWATDDTYLRVGTNAPLGTDANILFLKTEGKWPETKDGTALTVKTKDTSGKTRTYSFLIDFTEVKPKYALIRIYPDEAAKPIVALSTMNTVPSPVSQGISGGGQPLRNDAANSAPPPNTPKASTPSSQEPPTDRKPLISSSPSPSSPEPPLNTDVKPSASQSSASQPSDAMKQDKIGLKASPPPQPSTASLEKLSGLKQETSISTAVTNPPNNPKRDLSATLFSHAQANALVRGLTVATKTGEIGGKSMIASKIQSIVRRLRRGEALMEASKQETVEQKTINRLFQLGNYKDPTLTPPPLPPNPVNQP